MSEEKNTIEIQDGKPGAEERAGGMTGETQAEEESQGSGQGKNSGGKREKNQEPDGQETDSQETEAGSQEAETGNQEAETGETSGEEDSGGENPGMGKKEKKDKKTEQIEELTDRLQRSMAEFDNYRKRTEKEKASMYMVGSKEVIEKILPVVDNFERGMAAAPEGDSFADGMQMVYKQLMAALSDLGVQPIEAAGQPFDPNLHNAVMHVEDPEVGENMVVEELQKGYQYKDFVVRHSMVKVAN